MTRLWTLIIQTQGTKRLKSYIKIFSEHIKIIAQLLQKKQKRTKVQITGDAFIKYYVTEDL